VHVLLSVVGIALSGACASSVQQRGPGAGVAAQLSVERFLQAANARDIEAMGRSFGTTDGASWDTGGTFGCAFKKIGSWFGGESCVKRHDVEIRMEAIASVLKHEDYRVTREESVPGRLNVATRVWVDLTVQGARVADIPFVVVRSGDAWLVEQVDLARVMVGAR
jgi:hypothetical protein